MLEKETETEFGQNDSKQSNEKQNSLKLRIFRTHDIISLSMVNIFFGTTRFQIQNRVLLWEKSTYS